MLPLYAIFGIGFAVAVCSAVVTAWWLAEKKYGRKNDPIGEGLEQTIAGALNISLDEARQMLKEMDESHPSEVQPNLYLGNVLSSQDLTSLRHHGITHILNATTSLPNVYGNGLEPPDLGPAFVYRRVPLEDNNKEDLLAHLDGAVDFIADALSKPGNGVLVHCQQGVSRSASIVLGYLVREWNHSFEEAMAHVKQRRFIQPGDGFIRQLRSYANLLASSRGRAD